MRRLGVSLLLLFAVSGGAYLALRWPDREPALDCEPSRVHLDDAGIARCGSGAELSAAQTLTAGGKLDLNRATAEELALVPGVGPTLARALVARRAELGGFKSWAEVDAVAGVGEHKLESLKATAEIR